MTTTAKPAWVEALDHAQEILQNAANGVTPEYIDAKTRMAYAWMDLAKMLKGKA